MKATAPIRFSILLPLLFLALSVLLAKVGETRRDNIIRSVVARHGFLFEPLPDNVALERFIDYAINAPAWAAAWNMPHIFPISESETHLGIMRYEAHWWYFLFVLMMWH